jgi:hypothetical protein
MPYGIKGIEKLFYKPESDYTYFEYRQNSEQYDMTTLYYNTNDYFIHFDCFRYACMVDLYTALFDKCHVFLYEEFEQDLNVALARLEDIVDEPIIMKSTEPENKSLSLTELEKRRKENELSFTIKSKSLRKLIRALTNLGRYRSVKNLNEVVHKMVAGYYSEDNKLLKERLPFLNWDAFPDKYT